MFYALLIVTYQIYATTPVVGTDEFLLLDGTNFLLLDDNSNFLLWGS
jgi:hypothetical protein